MTTPEGLQSAMRRALRERGLDLLFWVDEVGEYVDVHGRVRPVSLDTGGKAGASRRPVRRIRVMNDGRPLAAVDVEAESEQRRHLVRGCLCLLSSRLLVARPQAVLQARVEVATEALSRLVLADNEIRSAMEREIHDGLHQRLLASALDLSRIEAGVMDADTRRHIVATRQGLLDLVSEVRRLVRGIHPVDLSQGGVSGALVALAEQLGVPVRLHDLAGRLPAAIEAAAYFALTEALINSIKHAAGATVEITLTRDGSFFVGRVCDDGPGGAAMVQGGGLAAQRDRIQALRGWVTLRSDDSGTTVEVSVPCM